MNYEEIQSTSGTYSLQEHLMALKAGFKSPLVKTDDLRRNVLELKWGRSADAQKLVLELVEYIPKDATIWDTAVIDDLIQQVNADQLINKTPHTFQELWEQEDDDDIWA